MSRLAVCVAVMAAAVSAGSSPPAWPSSYVVTGTLSIPYAELDEPFMAFADLDRGRSRIDYYGGMDQTFQRADVGKYGTAFKLVPMTDENVVNQINCFQVNGTKDDPTKPQSVLPDLTGFAFKGQDTVGGQDCEKWQKTDRIGKKKNKYTIWLRSEKSTIDPKVTTAMPVLYEMRGYNTLLGSHYDHYYVTYETFSPETPDPSVFDAYQAHGSCHGWPGPGRQHSMTMNPMAEFIEGSSGHIDAAFEHFKDTHGKAYDTPTEHDTRKDIFRQNLRFIHSTNRRGLSFKTDINHLADWTSHEMNQLRGRLRSTPNNGGQAFSYSASDLRDAPSYLDWRLFGAVTPVKDQSVCGSCWSFGTVGTLEGARFLATGGTLEPLSQQALIDCSWGFGNNGCDGGEDFRVYQFMLKHGGIPTEEDYGPYLGNDGFCHINDTAPAFQIKGWVNVTSGDASAMKVALAKNGPISVGIDASQRSLSFYSDGVYYDPKCKNGLEDLDHAVLAVGYGEINGEGFWIVKNSWSTYWGNDGYILMSQKNNNCGVTTAATYVIPK